METRKAKDNPTMTFVVHEKLDKDEQKVTVDNVVYSKHAKTASVIDTDGKKVKARLGYTLLPIPGDDVKTEDDYGDWLADLVARGILSWEKIATLGLYNLVLLGHKITQKAWDSALTPPEEPSVDYLLTNYYERAKKALGNKEHDYGLLLATAKKIHADAMKDGQVETTWNPDEHVVYPKDITE
jgi:hypothetical protein